jgi:flavorubredoxin
MDNGKGYMNQREIANYLGTTRHYMKSIMCKIRKYVADILGVKVGSVNFVRDKRGVLMIPTNTVRNFAAWLYWARPHWTKYCSNLESLNGQA